MKSKTLFLLIFLSAGFTSCQKKSCYICTIRTVVQIGNNTSSSTTTNTLCDATGKDVDNYQKTGTTHTESGSGINIVRSTTTTTCQKQ